MRIVQFIGSMNVGGSENLLMNILRNIDRTEYEFIFMENTKEKSYYTDEIRKLGATVVKTPRYSTRNLYKYYRFLVNYFAKNDIDVVHAHTYLHSWIVLAAAKRAGVKKRVAHAHSAMKKYDNGSALKWYWLKRLLLRYATDLIACSIDAGGDLFNGDERTEVIKNPVDLARFDTDQTATNELRRIYGIAEETMVIGVIGRLVSVKNPQFIIEIAKRLDSKDLNFCFLWLGDGEMRQEIEDSVSRLGASGRVVMPGNVNTVPEHIKLFDVFVMPSVYEGLSLAAVEVQSQGVPCLFSDAVSRDTQVNSNVWFLPTKNVDDWVDVIIKKPSMISKAEAYANIQKEGMDIDTVVERVTACYAS